MIIDDVVRALECCKDGRCDICGRQGQMADERMCRFDLLEHAYHVIGCQKKEIDKLTADVDALEKGVIREKERADALANGRNDGIREFTEKLKAKSDYTYIAKIDCLSYRILDRELGSLVKEMTEVSTGEGAYQEKI